MKYILFASVVFLFTAFSAGAVNNNGAVLQGEVSCWHLNVRKEPSLDSSVVDILKKGTKVTILDQRGSIEGWLKISTKQVTGYVRNRPKYVVFDRNKKVMIEKNSNEAGKKDADKILAKLDSQKKIVEAITNKEVIMIDGLNEEEALNSDLSLLDSEINNEKKELEDPEKKLTQMEVDDGQDDTALFLEGLNAYREQNLSGTIEKLNRFIKIYPSGRYTERACFLLAKSYEQLYSDSIPTHFNDIRNHYKDAVNRFPRSIYVPGAMLAIGNLYFKTKCYTEAMGYYNLILRKDKSALCAMSAMIQKAKIFYLKKRRRKALSVLKEVVSRDADIRQRTEAKIEMSKILYEMNAFHESLDVLSELRTTNPQSIYQYPEISLSLGNNYYQLGDNASVRENLFRFYNSCPDREMSHLILTRIGDTYQDDGLIKDAVKIYQMVCERYPDTEGARISIIRLAEQQEEWNLKTENIIENIIELFPVKIGKDIDKPEEIYKNIINNPSGKDKKDSLAQLAMFKLAVLYQKQKDYNKSLETLKKFFKRYPRTSLKKEYKYILQNTMELILKKDMERERYISIINIYEREKELFSKIDSPEPFLMIAKACIHLNLENMATEMFSIADPLLPDKEKPPELLFFLSRSLSEKEKLKSALIRLNLLINNYPSDKYAQYAYRLKGSIFLTQKRYVQAAEMFSSALKYPLTPCKRTILLTDKAGALARCSFNEKALEAVREADSLKEACDSVHDYIYQEIGDVYLNLSYPKEAAAIFNQAIEMAKDKANIIPLKFKVAQCYWLLNKRKDSLALYDQISSFDDPFWSNLAKERIEEINFNREIRAQKSEVGGQKSEVRGQKSEVGGQKSEVRSQRSEVRSQRSEVRGRRTSKE